MIKKPRGTEDILPNDSKIWRLIENTAHEICATAIKKFVLLFSRILLFLAEELGTRQTWFKKKCIHSTIRAGVALLCVQREPLHWLEVTLKIRFMRILNPQSYII